MRHYNVPYHLKYDLHPQGTMFEGGTRAVSFVHGRRWLDKSSYVNDKLLHITDWMPTLLTLGEGIGNISRRHAHLL